MDIETIIIGGGQAGLAMSGYLREHGREHVVLERQRVAERWRTQRWDSLMFLVPNWAIELPGQVYAGADPEGFSHRDAVIAFIEDYAARIKAPVRTGVDVRALHRASGDGWHRVVTDEGNMRARNVVIATGPFQRARTPAFSSNLPADIAQMHASDYRNPAQVPEGAVLVVGTGASGCQICEELRESGRRVYHSMGRHRRVPRRYRGRDVFWWRRMIGELDRTAETTPEAERPLAPLMTGVRGGYDVDPRSFAGKGVTLLGHVRDVRDNRIAIAPDLDALLKDGDRTFAEFVRSADDYVATSGIDAPPAPDAPPPPRAMETPDELDLRAAGIRSVIWATGYVLDFAWVDVPVFDANGRPLHRRGVTTVPGIYFLGLPWLHKMASSFLNGVGEDARYLAEHITARG